MKESFYNIKVRYGKHDIIFNTRTSKVIPEKEFLDGIKWKNIGSADKNLQNLCDMGFFVDDAAEELADVCRLRHDKMFDTSKLVLTLLMSFSCNLACSYCYEYSKKNDTNMTSRVIDDVLAFIESQILERQIKSVKIRLYGGEPLYNMDGSVDVINRAKALCEKYNVNFKLHITTNATLLSEELLSALEGVDVSFQITIDGAANTHNAKRYYKDRKGTYDVIVKNLNILYDSLPLARFIIRINYDNGVLETIPELLRDIVHVKSRSSVTLQKIFQISRDDIDHELLDKTISLINRMGIVVKCSAYSFGLHCNSALKNYYVINYDGKVKRCQSFQRENGIIGALKGSDIMIDESIDIENDIDNLPAKCKSCKLFPICLGPCYKVLCGHSEHNCNIHNIPEKISFMLKQKLIAQYANKHKSNI